MRRIPRLLKWLAGFLLGLACLGFGLRFLDGPFFVFHGGPFRSGDFVDYAKVDWESLDRHRELELELVGTGRSVLLWFSVSKDRPYISCGFGCEDSFLTRWPSQLQDDSRVVVRLDGMRTQASAERVPRDSDEHDKARSHRRAKFNAGENSRSKAEQHAHDAIVRMGSDLSDSESKVPTSQLFRIVAPRSDPDPS
jgi:hypothetical protein